MSLHNWQPEGPDRFTTVWQSTSDPRAKAYAAANNIRYLEDPPPHASLASLPLISLQEANAAYDADNRARGKRETTITIGTWVVDTIWEWPTASRGAKCRWVKNVIDENEAHINKFSQPRAEIIRNLTHELKRSPNIDWALNDEVVKEVKEATGVLEELRGLLLADLTKRNWVKGTIKELDLRVKYESISLGLIPKLQRFSAGL